ncbi:putative ribonuclease H-like domain-containing protein [Tanacetum coccineum]
MINRYEPVKLLNLRFQNWFIVYGRMVRLFPVLVLSAVIRLVLSLTSSRPDIMFSVCACLRFQVQPKVSHLNAVKRIFRYLKCRPKLGLWYPKDSPFILDAFSDSDYAGASLDRKSTTGGCQFLGSRLISLQCKKQTMVANSTTEAEYIAASHYCGQVEAMQKELLQFKLQQVWILIDLPIGKRAIGIKWVFRNKKDKRGIMIRNKASLVVHGHRQEEGIDYEEVFAPMARIEAIRLFLAYDSLMGFLLRRSVYLGLHTFLYGTFEEEVYVTQPPGFKDPDNPDKVYKVVKALYGLHQASRALYETLANYLFGNGFQRGKIDQTLFIMRQKGEILLVQKEDGIFIIQDKYVDKILKKFNYTDVKSASTLVDLEKPLVKDGDANDVDVHLYRSMIGSLMYLTTFRPDIMFVVCACARFQVTLKTSHLLAVKRIFRYLKGKPTLDLWYSRDSPFELVLYTYSDYVGATQDRKSTTREKSVKQIGKSKEFGTLRYPSLVVPMKKVGDEAVHKKLGDRMERAATTASSLEVELESGNINKTQSMATLNGSSPQGTGSATARTTDDGEVEITARIDRQVKTITEASLRRNLKLEDSDGITSLPNTEIFEQLALIGYVSDSDRLTFQKGHFSPQWRKLFSNMKRVSRGYSRFPTQTKVADEATFISVDVDVGGAVATNIGLDAGQGSGTVHKSPTRPHDSPLLRVHTLGSDEGSMQQNELIDLVTKLKDRVEVLENDLKQTKKVYSSAITKLIIRVKKLEKKVKSNKARRRARIVVSEDEDAEEDSSKQGRKISQIDKDPTISLVQFEQDMEYDFDVNTAEGFTTTSVPVTTAGIKISTANILVSTASVTLKVSTPAKNLVYIRRSAEKRKDKGKAIMKEDESLQEFDRARQEQEVIAEADQDHDINWSDPAVLRYHAVQNRSFSKAEVRKNIVWDQNHAFVPKDSEIEKEVMKRSGFYLQQESSKQVEEEIVQQDVVVAEQVMKESSRKVEGRLKRNTSKARKNKDKI